MYIIDINKGTQQYKAETYEEAVGFAKQFENENKDKYIEIIRSTDAVVAWTSKDSPALRAYTELDAEQWLNLTQGTKEQSDKPSIYFDIDGTLGYFYQDARGMVYPDEVLDPKTHYFRDIEPHPFIIDVARTLEAKGYDVCVISAADKDTIRDKYEWLKQYCPFIKDENICFCPLGADKTNFVKGNADRSILVDDYNKNLNEWQGVPVKAVNSINSPNPNLLCIEGYEREQEYEKTGKKNAEYVNCINSVVHSFENTIVNIDPQNNKYEHHVDLHSLKIDKTNAVISTVKLSDSLYETMVMSIDGYKEFDVSRTGTLSEAKEAHASFVEKYSNMSKVTDLHKSIGLKNEIEADNTAEKKLEAMKSVDEVTFNEMEEKLTEALTKIFEEMDEDDKVIHTKPNNKDEMLSPSFILDRFNIYKEARENGEMSGISFATHLKYYLVSEDDLILNKITDTENQHYEYIRDQLPDDLKDFYDDWIATKYDRNISDFLCDNGYIYTINVEDFVGECYLNLILNTAQEKNYTQGTIPHIYPSYDRFDEFTQIKDIDRFAEELDNSLTYLINQQGHKVEEVFRELYINKQNFSSPLVTSIKNEAENMSANYANVTVCASARGKKLLDALDNLANKRDFIEVSRDAVVGLFDEQETSQHTTNMSIMLEKPFVFPADMVRLVQFENNRREYIYGNKGNSVLEMTDLKLDAWQRGKITATNEEQIFVRENVNKLWETYQNYDTYMRADEKSPEYAKAETALTESRVEALLKDAYERIGQTPPEPNGSRLTEEYYNAVWETLKDDSTEKAVNDDKSSLRRMKEALASIDKAQVHDSGVMLNPKNYSLYDKVNLINDGLALNQLANDDDKHVRQLANEAAKNLTSEKDLSDVQKDKPNKGRGTE